MKPDAAAPRGPAGTGEGGASLWPDEARSPFPGFRPAPYAAARIRCTGPPSALGPTGEVRPATRPPGLAAVEMDLLVRPASAPSRPIPAPSPANYKAGMEQGGRPWEWTGGGSGCGPSGGVGSAGSGRSGSG